MKGTSPSGANSLAPERVLGWNPKVGPSTLFLVICAPSSASVFADEWDGGQQKKLPRVQLQQTPSLVIKR
jgi:hypothetical protein